MMIHNGRTYARVSDILRPFTSFDLIDQEVLKRKCDLGTMVHKAIQDEIEGDLPIISSNGIGYFKSFEKWRSFIRPDFLESEMRYYDDHKMLTGCIDALAKIQGCEKAVLIDFKTSAQESPTTWPMQAHMYYYLAKNSYPIAPRFLFLKLDPKGFFPRVFEYKYDQNIMAKCMEAIDSFWESVAINPQ